MCIYKDTGNMKATAAGGARELPNGYMGMENRYESGAYADVNNARELHIAETFYNNRKNTGGSFGAAPIGSSRQTPQRIHGMPTGSGPTPPRIPARITTLHFLVVPPVGTTPNTSATVTPAEMHL